MVAARRIVAFLLMLLSSLGTASATDTYVFAFPPREGAASAVDTYGPIADFLSKVTGAKFVLNSSDNWLSYQSGMQKGTYDLVFDGPHFASWRIAKQQHVPLARLDGHLVFALAVSKDHGNAQSVADLAGRGICGMSPPNLATLTILAQFDNPARQPRLVRSESFKDAYKRFTAGQCEGVAIQTLLLKKFDTKGATRTLFISQPLPNQGFTAGPRIPAAMQQKIKEALLSPEGQVATAKLRGEYGNKPLVPATREEYNHLGALLRDVWGFQL